MPITVPESAVHVVVGVVADGENVLVTKRPKASHQGGKWEFPGGKVHAGESVRRALARELFEELGIEVHVAYPLIQISHAYTDRNVLLDVWRVTDFSGEPAGREGQPIQWVSQEQLTGLDFPDANRPIVQAARLPSLYLISDSRRFDRAGFIRRLERALVAGAPMLQLREPHLSSEDYRALAREVVALCRQYGARVLLNGEPQWVEECGANGVHLNSRRLKQWQTRPLDAKYWVAASTHDANELALAARAGVDFVVLSPVLPTTSHPQAVPLGWPGFQTLCTQVNVPVYALGGLRAKHLERARDAGAQGLAMISGVWDAPDMEEVIAAIRDA